jgi:hypothetical protein
MKSYLFTGLLLAIFAVSQISWAGFGDVLDKAKGGSPSGSSSTSAEYQADQSKRDQAKSKARELNSYIKTLRGTSYSSAVSKLTRKIGSGPGLKKKFKSKWLITTYDPACVRADLGKGPDGKVNSGSAWMTHAGDGSNCATDYRLK